LGSIVKGDNMRVIVDFNLCVGNAICMGISPEVFDMNDDEELTYNEHPDESLRSEVQEAVRACPTGAIRLED
jgi:ferredoxin